jgi:hypothetical protein
MWKIAIVAILIVGLILFLPYIIGEYNQYSILRELSIDFTRNKISFQTVGERLKSGDANNVISATNFDPNDPDLNVIFSRLGYMDIYTDNSNRVFFEKGYSKAYFGVARKLKCIVYVDSFNDMLNLGKVYYWRELSDKWYVCFSE